MYDSLLDELEDDVVATTGEVEDLLKAHSGGNKRLAVDKIMLHGLRAFEARGFPPGRTIMAVRRSEGQLFF